MKCTYKIVMEIFIAGKYYLMTRRWLRGSSYYLFFYVCQRVLKSHSTFLCQTFRKFLVLLHNVVLYVERKCLLCNEICNSCDSKSMLLSKGKRNLNVS